MKLMKFEKMNRENIKIEDILLWLIVLSLSVFLFYYLTHLTVLPVSP